MAKRSSKRAIIYTRQSTKREESVSLEDQERAGRWHAEQHGYVVLRVETDPGITGLDFNKRPGIRHAIELVEAGQADVVIVHRWSRLARNTGHARTINDRIKVAGGRCESALEGGNEPTAGGELSRDMQLLFAEYESKVKSEQWRTAHANRLRKGLPASGRASFGYQRQVHPDGRSVRDAPVIPHPVHADVVRELYDRFIAGQGWKRLAEWLNEGGYATSSRKNDVRGGRFTPTTVARILDSGFAAGRVWVHDPGCKVGREPRDNHTRTCQRRIPIEGAHEPVIAETAWRAYKRERDRRRGTPKKSQAPKWPLGGGLTVCSLCGANLVVSSYTSPKARAICSAWRNRGTCAGVSINFKKLESRLLVELEATFLKRWADAAEIVAGTDVERARLQLEVDEARATEDRIREGRKATQRLVARGVMSEDEALEALQTADAELRDATTGAAEVQAQLDGLSPDKDAYARLVRVLESYADDDLPPEELNAQLRRIIRRVVVGPTTVIIEPWVGEPVTVPREEFAPRRPRRDREATRGADGRFARRAVASA